MYSSPNYTQQLGRLQQYAAPLTLGRMNASQVNSYSPNKFASTNRIGSWLEDAATALVTIAPYAPPDLPFPQAPVSDNFNYTEDPLSNGGKWVALNRDTTVTNTFKANGSGMITHNAVTDPSMYWAAQQFTNPEVEIKASDTATYIWFGIVPSSIGPGLITHGYYALGWASGGMSTIDLRVHDTGLDVVIGQFAGALSTGDKLGIRRLAELIQVFRNGVLIIEVNNTYWTGPGYVGIEGFKDQLVAMDDFRVAEYSPPIEFAQYVEPSGTTSVLFTPSAVEIAPSGYVDSGSGALTLTPSAADIAQYADSATNYLSITPSEADIQADVDANTGRVTFTPGPLSTGPNVPILYKGNVTENPISDGGKWQYPAQNLDGPLKADGTSIYGADATGAYSAFRTDQYWADGEVRVDSPQGGGTAHEIGIRVPPSTLGGFKNGYFLNWPEDVGERFFIYKYVAGTPTSLGSFDLSHVINGGEPIFFGANGTTIYARVEENFLGSVTDSTYTDAGNVAIYTTRQAAVGFKNFGAGALNDITGYIDTSAPGITLTPSSSDIYTTSGTAYTDSATDTLLLTPSGSDIELSVDSQTDRVTLTPSGTDIAQFVEAPTALVSLTPSSADIAADIEANTGRVTITPSVADIEASVDSNTGQITTTASAADTAQFVDSNTALSVITPSSTDVVADIEANTARVTLTPATTFEEHATFDANTGIVLFTPSAADIAAYVDSNTGIVLFGPSGIEIAQFVEPSQNLIKNPNALVDVSYAASRNSAVISRETSIVPSGDTTSFKVVTPGAVVFEGLDFVNTPNGAWDDAAAKIPVFAGDTYTFTVLVRGTTGSEHLIIGINWFDSGGGFISNQVTTFALTTSFSQKIIVGVAPTGAAFATPILETSTTQAITYYLGEAALFRYVPAATGIVKITPSSTDVAAFVDSNTGLVIITPSIADILAGVDSNTGKVTFSPSATDIAIYIDSGTSIVLITPSQTQEGIEHSDSATSISLLTPSSTDIAAFVDSGNPIVLLSPNISDISTYIDSSTSNVVITPSTTDIAAYVDSNVGIVLTVASSTDVAMYIDANTGIVVIVPSGVEGAVVDSATGVVIISPSTTDVAAYVDTNIGISNLVPSSSDIAAFTDSNSGQVILGPSGSDIVIYIDSNNAIVVINATGVETAQYVDSAIEIVLLTPSGTEQIISGANDFNTGVVTTTPSSTDIAAFVDTSIGTVVTTPVGTEISGYVDSNTATAIMTPSSSDISAYQDINTADLTNSPSSTEFEPSVDTATPVVGLNPSGADIALFVDATTGFIRISSGDIVDAAEVYTRIIASSIEGQFIALLLFGHAWRHWTIQNWKRYNATDYRHFTAEATKG